MTASRSGAVARRPARGVILPALVRLALVSHARAAAPNECCGLLVGLAGTVHAAVAMPNIAKRPRTRFEVDPASHIELRRILRLGRPRLDIVGVYHSHPAGTPVLSERDLADAHYDGWLHVVIGLSESQPRLAAYRITQERAVRVPLRRS